LVPTTDGSVYLPCEGIVRLEADGSYTHIHTDTGERLMTCKGIGVLHEQLPMEWFHRCHNTHVINLKKVHKLLRNGGNRVQMLTGDMVQVSRRKWRELQDAMNSLRS
jgi:two-component system LytT family response regulator